MIAVLWVCKGGTELKEDERIGGGDGQVKERGIKKGKAMKNAKERKWIKKESKERKTKRAYVKKRRKKR